MGEKVFRFLWPVLVLLSGAVFPGPEAGADGIVGTQTCKGCHEARYQTYAQSIHGRKAVPGSPANGNGCEDCHGPGVVHAEKGGGKGADILNFEDRRTAAQVKWAKCLGCHSETRTLAFWDMSRHKRGRIACSDCHRLHGSSRKLIKANEPDLCNSCHLDVRAQQIKQSHHPVREGRMRCTDCHQPHGGFGEHMIRANSINELCYECHSEKRGPFMWEHPPVDENCAVCHLPHGSNYNKLLKSLPPQLCQACHDSNGHPGAIYTRFETFQGTAAAGKNRMFARACLNCHSNIHGGSGPSSARGKIFVR